MMSKRRKGYQSFRRFVLKDGSKTILKHIYTNGLSEYILKPRADKFTYLAAA